MRRVVITGVGIVSAAGRGAKENWGNASLARTGVGMLSSFDCSKVPVRIAAEVKGGLKDWKELGLEAPSGAPSLLVLPAFISLGLEAAAEAMKNAPLGDARFGVVVGTGFAPSDDIEKTADAIYRNIQHEPQPGGWLYRSNQSLPMLISTLWGLRGVSMSLSSACASGTHAVGEAYLRIAMGELDCALAGGSESAITASSVSGFAALTALSTSNDTPASASRPFDKNRNGFVLGEGAGFVLLEDMETALSRDAEILCEIVGYGLSSDAHHTTAPHPDGDGALAAMREALKTVSLDDVDYVNAHGTSTKLNDLIEAKAVARLFEGRAKEISISSTKGVTGHCLGAAGGIEAVLSVLSVQKGTMLPTAGLTEVDPELPPLRYVMGVAEQKTIRVAISNSFGFGGTNASVAFRRFTKEG